MKKVLLIVGSAGIAFLLIKSFKSKSKSKKMFTEQDAKEAILAVQKSYGREMASTIEKMLRLETNHFKSKQYQLTGSAGMEVGKWKAIPKDATNGTVKMNDADLSDGTDEFIKWKSVKDFCFFLAEYINRYKGNFARWYSVQKEGQKTYADKINSVKSKFV